MRQCFAAAFDFVVEVYASTCGLEDYPVCWQGSGAVHGKRRVSEGHCGWQQLAGLRHEQGSVRMAGHRRKGGRPRGNPPPTPPK